MSADVEKRLRLWYYQVYCDGQVMIGVYITWKKTTIIMQQTTIIQITTRARAGVKSSAPCADGGAAWQAACFIFRAVSICALTA